MTFYQPKKIRALRLLAMAVRFIARLVKLWPLLLVILLFASPATPHVRMDYQYQDINGKRMMWNCHYFGVRGFVYPEPSVCPFVTLIHHPPLFTTL